MSLRQIAADVLAASVFTGLAASAQVSIDDLRSASGGHVLEIGYFVASGSAANGFRASDRELAMWALQTWQRTIGPAVRFAPRSEAEALIRVYWAGPVDGQYGEMRPLVVGDRHGAATYIRPDTDSLGDQIGPRAAADALLRDSVVYLTCLHELGHALGLPHTSDFRDIMYFFGFGGDIVGYFTRYRAQLRSRGDIARVSGLSDADVRAIRDLFPRP